eukprot:TRINITY_DN19573_c0_g1_i1.p1 TRINITY_DN19573_c0_g1~~TRINITY_DN19573_c0_g1_i1.p1  ORF type:complete len:444 (+),score=14.19 TRINITY_DN19573_c0_g1_i1:13-1344(+)
MENWVLWSSTLFIFLGNSVLSIPISVVSYNLCDPLQSVLFQARIPYPAGQTPQTSALTMSPYNEAAVVSAGWELNRMYLVTYDAATAWSSKNNTYECTPCLKAYFSPKGEYVLCANDALVVIQYKVVVGGNPIRQRIHIDGLINAVAWGQGSYQSLVVIGTSEGTIGVINTRAEPLWALIKTLKNVCPGVISSVIWSTDGANVYIACQQVKLQSGSKINPHIVTMAASDWTSAELIQFDWGHDIRGLALSPKGGYLGIAGGDFNGFVAAVDLQTKKPLFARNTFSGSPYSAVVFHPETEGKLPPIMFVNDPNTCHVSWFQLNAHNPGEPVGILRAPECPQSPKGWEQLGFVRDTATLAVMSFDQLVVWNATMCPSNTPPPGPPQPPTPHTGHHCGMSGLGCGWWPLIVTFILLSVLLVMIAVFFVFWKQRQLRQAGEDIPLLK